MSGMKEIRTKIKSVQNTRKITKAMEMVAASKMRRAQERMRAARPYADKIRNIAAHMGGANPEYRHPFLARREQVKNAGVIVITTDKGLCGGLNTNVLRAVTNELRGLNLRLEGARMLAEELLLQPQFAGEPPVPQLQPPVRPEHRERFEQVVERRGSRAQQRIARGGKLELLGAVLEDHQQPAIGHRLADHAQVHYSLIKVA